MPIGQGANSWVNAFYEDTTDNMLYIGGWFLTFDSDTVWGIVKYDGQDAVPLGTGQFPCGNACPGIVSIEKYNNDIYVAGAMSGMEGDTTGGFSRWNGTSWDSLGYLQDFYGDPADLADLEVYNGELYMCGTISYINGQPATGVAKWDGVQFTDLGFPYTSTGGSPCNLLKLQHYNGDLIVVSTGCYDQFGGAHKLWKYDGVTWDTMDFNINGFGVGDIDVYNGELYVAGLFDTLGGNPGNYIVGWDGSQLRDVGGGLWNGGANAQVFDLEVWNGRLYAAGLFTEAGGIPAKHLAYWDGVEWCTNGGDFLNGVYEIGHLNDTMIVACHTHVDGIQVNRIAKWVGGSYVDTCGLIATSVFEPNHPDPILLYPNPASEFINIEMEGYHEVCNYKLYLVSGQIVLSGQFTGSAVQLSLNGLCSGYYLLNIETENSVTVRKILVTE